MIARLAPSASCPSVLFVAGSADDFLSVGRVAVKWAIRVPALSIAVAVSSGVWDEYLTPAQDSRTKALLREGELSVPVIDAATVKQTLTEAGAVGSAVAAVAATGLMRPSSNWPSPRFEPPPSRRRTKRKTTAAGSPPNDFCSSFWNPARNSRAIRVERRPRLRVRLRPAEMDLLCRSPRIAIELDGYYHFLTPDDYRRDRTKDWELQRRGFVVLRFLAEEYPQLEMIRDRILEALHLNPPGAAREPPRSAPRSPDTAVADLVLVRMALPSKTPVAPSAVRKDVGKLLNSDFSAAEFDEMRSGLASAGFLAKGKRKTFAITNAGRERAVRPPGHRGDPVADELVNSDRQVPIPESRRALGGRGGQAGKRGQTGRLRSQAKVRARRRGWFDGQPSARSGGMQAARLRPARRRSTAYCVRY